jgi:hypothetical protein
MDKLVITERPVKWNKSQYTVVTLNDLTGESLDKLIAKPFSFILIDETVKNEDILLFQKESEYQFATDVIIPLLKEYSIFIRPQSLTSVKNEELLYQGVFRFENNLFYDIYSKESSVDLSDFFTDKSGIILVQNTEEDSTDTITVEEALDRGKKTNPTEMVVVMIRKVSDYDEFEKNMRIFNNIFPNKPVKEYGDIESVLLKDENIQNSDYLNNLFSKINQKYNPENNSFPYNKKPFPYNKDEPMNIYFVVILHNQLLRDPKFKTRAKYISQNIGKIIYGPRYKGNVIQSVSFLPIKGYDAVDLFKIKNDDNYYIWMRNENPNGLKRYETPINNLDGIRKNILNLQIISKGGTRKKYKHVSS